jgi:hypothetical protein
MKVISSVTKKSSKMPNGLVNGARNIKARVVAVVAAVELGIAATS